MTEHYVTLFDSLFLPQGLALHTSMERHLSNFTLWIVCVDDEAFVALQRLNLNHVRLLQLSKLETPELLSVKSRRDKGEYCWTVTPFAPRFVFEADADVQRVTYLDADIWFRDNPNAIFDEFEASRKAVLITEHAFAAEHDHSAISGKFCVQFIIFKRGDSEDVRNKWAQQCLEWCSSQPEDGKFGDQKYLDDWPRDFKNQVHILQNKELCLGPWNVMRFPYSNAVFYHFSGLRLVSPQKLTLGDYPIPRVVLVNVYRPYSKDIRSAVGALMDIGFHCRPQQKTVSKLSALKAAIRNFRRKFIPKTSIKF